MDTHQGWKPVAIICFVAFWVMFAIAAVALYQRDQAKQVRADVDGKTLICRLEEKH